MRVGVLEWASCGGAVGAVELPESIRREGWAMCRALIESLLVAGHEPVACLKHDLPRTVAAQETIEYIKPGCDVRSLWRCAYAPCDVTIVVAPESDGVLCELEAWCQSAGIRTCSSDATFIQNSGDKWRSAQWWHCHQVPHPPTQLLSKWRAPVTAHADAERWALKMRDGAGCESMQRLSTEEVVRLQLNHPSADRWIVQPWISGLSYSRSVIVDAAGNYHWLPIVSQCLKVDACVQYQGGCVLPESSLSSDHERSLEQAVRSLPGNARGWIGVDFILSESGQLMVIEINPRLTTSFVGLSRACHASLADLIVKASLGLDGTWPDQWHSDQWKTVRFSAAGVCT